MQNKNLQNLLKKVNVENSLPEETKCDFIILNDGAGNAIKGGGGGGRFGGLGGAAGTGAGAGGGISLCASNCSSNSGNTSSCFIKW